MISTGRISFFPWHLLVVRGAPCDRWGVECGGGFEAGEGAEGIDAAIGEIGEELMIELELQVPLPTPIKDPFHMEAMVIELIND